MELTALDGTVNQWDALENSLRHVLASAAGGGDALHISLASKPLRGDHWDDAWDYTNAPWVDFDLDPDGLLRTTFGSNQFLDEPFKLGPDEMTQMVQLGFSEPEDIDPRNPSGFSWAYYFLRLDVRGTDTFELLAKITIEAFRASFHVLHPSLLEYMAWGACDDAARALGLVGYESVAKE